MLGPGPSMTPIQNAMWSQPPFISNQIYPPMNANMQPILTDPPMNPYGNQISQNSGGQDHRSVFRNGSRFRNSQRIPPWFKRAQPGWHEVSNELRPMNQFRLMNQFRPMNQVNQPSQSTGPNRLNPEWRVELPVLNAAEVNNVLNAE